MMPPSSEKQGCPAPVGGEADLSRVPWLTALHQSAPFAIITWNTAFEVVGWNLEAERVFGYSAEEMIGASADCLIAGDAVASVVPRVYRMLRDGSPFSSVNDNLTKSGKTITCRWFNTPLQGDDGEILGVASFCEDVTAQRRAERELVYARERSRLLMNAMQCIYKHPAVATGDLVRACRTITELAVTSLEVDRAAIWLMDRDGGILRCMDIFEPHRAGHCTSDPILEEEYPEYFERLGQGRLFVVTDIRTDERLARLREWVFEGQPYRSQMGVPLYSEGHCIGVMMMSTLDAKEDWNSQEQMFGAYLGDVLSGLWENDQRRQAQDSLREINETLEREVEARTAEVVRQKALLDVLLGNMTQGVTYIDADMNVVFQNAAYSSMFNVPESLQAPGTPVRALIRHMAERGEYGDVDVDSEVESRVAGIRSITPLRYLHRPPGGRIVETLRNPMPPDVGGVITTYTDMTDLILTQERLEAEKTRLEAATQDLRLYFTLLESTFNNISQGISLFDSDFRLRMCNRRFIEFLGFPDRLNQVGTPLEEFFRYNAERGEYGAGEVEEQVAERMDLARQMLPHHFVRRRPDGQVLEVDGRPLPGDVGGFVTTYTDVTEIINSRQELEQAKERAEQANGALQASLDDLRRTQAELVESEKMASLGGLVAGIAHEINTPVGIAVTAASLMQDHVQTLQTAYQNDALEESAFESFLGNAGQTADMIAVNLRRAADLISSFKRVAVDQTNGEIRPILLAEYVHTVLFSLQPRLRKTRVRTEVDIPDTLMVQTYPGAVSQVLSNLVMNAVIHGFGDGEEAGTIRISGRPLRDGRVELTVSDTGAGVEQENLKRILEPFFTTRRGRGGTGLGLHIVYNLVTNTLRGGITYSSQPGEGLTLVMTFPSLEASPLPGRGAEAGQEQRV